MQQFVAKCFAPKPTAKFLLLRPNAMLIKGQKESLVTSAIINKCLGIGHGENEAAGNAKSSTGLFSAVLELNEIFVREVKPMAKKIESKSDDPLTEELF